MRCGHLRDHHARFFPSRLDFLITHQGPSLFHFFVFAIIQVFPLFFSLVETMIDQFSIGLHMSTRRIMIPPYHPPRWSFLFFLPIVWKHCYKQRYWFLLVSLLSLSKLLTYLFLRLTVVLWRTFYRVNDEKFPAVTLRLTPPSRPNFYLRSFLKRLFFLLDKVPVWLSIPTTSWIISSSRGLFPKLKHHWSV